MSHLSNQPQQELHPRKRTAKLLSLTQLFFCLTPLLAQTPFDHLKSFQELRNNLYHKIAPGIVSVEVVHRSVPAWEIARLERWANECRVQPWRNGHLTEQEAEQWRDWCDSFLNEFEKRLIEGRAIPQSEDLAAWEKMVRELLSDWQSRERPFLVGLQTGSFDKFVKALEGQVENLDKQLGANRNKPLKPMPIRQNTGFLIDQGLVVSTLETARQTSPYHQIRVWSEAQVAYSTGEVIGQDPETNLALIRLSSPGAELVPTIRLKPCQEPAVGDFVYAFWHAFSQPLSMRTGEITGLLRKVPFFNYTTFIETSLPTSPGTLGGPLVNVEGELVGMGSVFMAQGTMSEITFALPTRHILSVVEQLQKEGSVKRARLGVFVGEERDRGQAQGLAPTQSNVGEPLTAPLQETQSTVGGSQVCIQRKKVIVRQVEPDSTAARNGVLPGDEIRAVNQEPVQGKMHFIATLSKFRPNDELVLEIIRHGAPTTISLTLDPIP